MKLMTQLWGDRTLIANATGCSSIYGGNLPTTPYTVNCEGRGPAWANSLFEDNAEFGMGFRLAIDKLTEEARKLTAELGDSLGSELVEAVLAARAEDETAVAAQRERVADLQTKLNSDNSATARRLLELSDYLVEKSVWIVGGDGWAYDIGYGGLDHVLASDKNVNILVLDTEVYSNTGGQASKATPLAAVAKFATGGKHIGKKDLGMQAMSYGHVYVAQVAFGAKDAQTVNAMLEAVSYDGPSLIIAYSPCIEHGYDLGEGGSQQDLAVKSGYWPLYRFDPRRIIKGEAPLKLDSKEPTVTFSDFISKENRFRMLAKSNPEEAARLAELGQMHIQRKWTELKHKAQLTYEAGTLTD